MTSEDHPFNDLLTLREASDLLAVHPNTLRRWSNRGLVTTYRVGPRAARRFKRQDIEFLLKESPDG